jgi:hypothetical protein
MRRVFSRAEGVAPTFCDGARSCSHAGLDDSLKRKL